MKAFILVVAGLLLVTAVAAPTAAAADPFPVCVTHPCGPDPVGLVVTVVEKAHYQAEQAVCFAVGQLGLQCQ